MLNTCLTVLSYVNVPSHTCGAHCLGIGSCLLICYIVLLPCSQLMDQGDSHAHHSCSGAAPQITGVLRWVVAMPPVAIRRRCPQMHGSRSCLHAVAAAAARALADKQRLNVRQHLQRQETEQTQPPWWQLHGRQPQRRLARSSYAGPCSSQAALAQHEKEQRTRCRTLSSRTAFTVRTLSCEGVRSCKACTNLVDGRVGRRRQQPAGLSALGGAQRRHRGGEGARAGARRR